MNILYVSKGFLDPSGGAESAARKTLLTSLNYIDTQRSNINLYILTSSRKISKKADYTFVEKIFNIFKNKKIKIKIKIILVKQLVDVPILKDLFLSLAIKKQILRIIKKEKIDLIHIHCYNTFYVYFSSKEANIPILYTVHDFPIQWPKPINFFPFQELEKYWIKYIKNRFKKLLLTAKSSKNIYLHALSLQILHYFKSKKINEKNIIYEPNRFLEPDNCSYFSKPRIKKREMLNLLFIGSMTHRKNFYGLINSLRYLEDHNINYKLIILGSFIPVLSKFYMKKTIIDNEDVFRKGNIYWMGYVSKDQFNKIIEVSDLVVLPSYSEASPLVVLESISKCKPIISTPVGSSFEILPRKFWIQRPTPEKIAEKIIDFWENQQQYQNMFLQLRKKFLEENIKNHFNIFSYYNEITLKHKKLRN